MNLLSTTALHLWQIENHLKYQFILILSNSSMSYKNFVSISGITITPYLDFHSQIWSFTTNICISCLIRIWVENCINFKMLVKLGQILFMSINKGKLLNFNLLQSIFSTNLKVHAYKKWQKDIERIKTESPLQKKTKTRAYLGLVKHPEVCVHVHGFLLGARLFVQFGGLIEFGLVAVNVSQEHHVVIFSPLLPLL